MTKKKVIYIISDIEKSLSFEWTAKHLALKFDLLFILIGKEKTALSSFLESMDIRVEIVSDEKFPSYIKKWLRIYSILQLERPAAVHVHLWRAMLLGLTAAWMSGVKRRVLTRHHATIHYVDYPSGRKWDILCNTLATDIVAISENVKDILTQWDKAKASKVSVIYHGFDLSYFKNIDLQRVNGLHEKYKLYSRPVIGVISRYMKMKGIQYIIPAFKKLKEDFPDAHLVLANAQGDYTAEIRTQLRQLPEGCYTEIQFEHDLAALYKVFDVFVHVPVDAHAEAFGQTYIEALAAEVPSVFTISGIAREFIVNEYNALVANYQDAEDIYVNMRRILNDAKIRSVIIENGMKSLEAKFNLPIMIDKLTYIYNK
ncbi:glycosyltransferase family 4 protein [Ohtaekwangia koreensis]|uniref:Glycosyltransferase involved in cell wall bisynthesis n=1 Tax=Ohtaekwangia koreensis TaxID=688867 RepID=A0A1T5LNV0_9BACT|nr:glycosyltransferase family 4 protein [Ohtaekwangia koreensis]SKC77239.1 Glycosyltransferase involved in cell wall bisynthesis [Ohtaekwangia koreensis]